MKKRKHYMSVSGSSGFTFVEMLVALIVSSVILTAVATLAYAMGSANDQTNDTSKKQAQVRFAMIRVSELIRQCKLIGGSNSGNLAVWRADDNGDGQINIEEMVYVESGSNSKLLRFCEFSAPVSLEGQVLSLSDIKSGTAKPWLMTNCTPIYTTLLPECENVSFSLDASPPLTRSVGIMFDISENGIVNEYQISCTLRCWAGNLLSSDGNHIVSDDD